MAWEAAPKTNKHCREANKTSALHTAASFHPCAVCAFFVFCILEREQMVHVEVSQASEDQEEKNITVRHLDFWYLNTKGWGKMKPLGLSYRRANQRAGAASVNRGPSETQDDW